MQTNKGTQRLYPYLRKASQYSIITLFAPIFSFFYSM